MTPDDTNSKEENSISHDMGNVSSCTVFSSPVSEDVEVFGSLQASYNPYTDWLDGSTPLHPFFDHAAQIETIVSSIKDDILSFALEACHLILDSFTETEKAKNHLLADTLSHAPDLWRGVILAQHYGVVYFMSRCEARSRYQPLLTQNPITADAIDNFLRSHDSAGIRAINYAVHAYVSRGNLRVEYATTCIPPNAIAAIGPRHIVVRTADFNDRPALDVLACPMPMWDLHDLAHLSCATLNQELYGNKYQGHLLRLPKSLTALIRSPGIRTATGPSISDGLVFSELLTKLFTDAVASSTGSQHQTYKALCSELATELVEYFLGKRALNHPSTTCELSLPVPISPTQLAVLVQNKSYELPASEIEQRVFTRGGPVGAREDVLQALSARERVAWLAKSKSWGYFEVRNTIKHRAHKEAYKIVCDVLIESAANEKETELLKKIRRNLLYEDWAAGERVVLWDLLEVGEL